MTDIPVRDPSRQIELPDVVPARCEGDHFFENICADCDHAQPDGPCSICPHIGPAHVCRMEHFSRRPCQKCKGANLRTVRVRMPIGWVP